MKTNVNLWSYLDHFFIEREMFRKTVLDKIKTHRLCSVTSPPPPKKFAIIKN